MAIAQTAIIHPNVKLGRNVRIEDFCIIGCPPRDAEPGELSTTIGDNAIIRSHTVIYAGTKIGKNFSSGNKANIRELKEIGHNVSIGTLSVIEHHVAISNNVRIHSQVFVPEYSIIEENGWLGPNVVLINAKYPRSVNVKANLKGPCIRNGAIIGANATLLPAVIIGEHALVGAGSVVTKDVEKHTVVAGNPAKAIGTIEQLPY